MTNQTAAVWVCPDHNWVHHDRPGKCGEVLPGKDYLECSFCGLVNPSPQATLKRDGGYIHRRGECVDGGGKLVRKMSYCQRDLVPKRYNGGEE